MKRTQRSLDLGFGFPRYMTPFWGKEKKKVSLDYQNFADYNSAEPTKQMFALIKNMHGISTKGIEDTIVVGFGASQMVAAAAYAYKKVHKIDWWIMKDTYWGRLKRLILFGNVMANIITDSSQFNKYNNAVNFIVHPNNPDGCIMQKPKHKSNVKNNFVVVDACYAWPQYDTHKTGTSIPEGDVTIFSLAKSLGLAGLRIGYALCKDVRIAQAMREYVELSTGGYSTVAEFTAGLLSKKQIKECLAYGKQKLDQRRAILNNLIEKVDLPFVITNLEEPGMFLWCRHKTNKNGKKAIEKQYNINSVEGSFFGADDTYFRLNLGCSDSEFKELIRRLNATKAVKSRNRRV